MPATVKHLSLYFVILVLFVGFIGCGDDSGQLSRVEHYLRSDEYTRLVLEVDYVDGYEPRERVEDEVVERLERVVEKPDGVAVERHDTIASRGEDHRWSSEELRQLARDSDDLSVGGNTIKMNVLFVDGEFEENDDDRTILGLAWGNRNIAIFKQTLEENCEGLLTSEDLCRHAEQAVFTHEVGHVLGLVDNGVQPRSNHHDVEHGAHCNNDECVMFWRYDGTDVIGVLEDRLGNTDGSLDFDAACREDLEAVSE